MYCSTIVFRIYGLVCGVVLILFIIFNFYNITEGKFSTELGEEVDPRNAMQGEVLAPHGVPSSGFRHTPREEEEEEYAGIVTVN